LTCFIDVVSMTMWGSNSKSLDEFAHAIKKMMLNII